MLTVFTTVIFETYYEDGEYDLSTLKEALQEAAIAEIRGTPTFILKEIQVEIQKETE